MKVKVIKDTDTTYITSMEAVVGMTLRTGKVIEKVNNKTILARGIYCTEKIDDASIWYTEAVKHGLEEKEYHDSQLEASKLRRFKEGELWYEETQGKTLYDTDDEVIKAGYKFAQATAMLRELALKGLD